jgi:hypothetical protein
MNKEYVIHARIDNILKQESDRENKESLCITSRFPAVHIRQWLILSRSGQYNYELTQLSP